MPRKVIFQPSEGVSFQSESSWKNADYFNELGKTFISPQGCSPVLETLDSIDPRACVFIRDVLSKEECQAIIQAAEKTGFHQRQFEGQGQDSASCVVDCPPFAQAIFERISDLLPAKSHYDAGLGLVVRDLDLDDLVISHFGSLVGLNTSVRVERYRTNQRLKMHRDGLVSCKYHGPNTFTIFALLIYLNDDYQGGFTRFALSKSPKDPMDLYEFEDVRGRTGDALLFRHEILHAGSPIHSANSSKYVLRLDLAYKLIE